MIKTALITGATGGIGGAFARELSLRGYQLFLPVRDMDSPAAKALLPLPGAHVALCNVEDAQVVDQYIASLKENGKHITVFILAAGVFKRDNKFPGETIVEKQQAAIASLTKANFVTKQTIFAALNDHFKSDKQKEMIGIIIGSHAANFGEDHEFRPEQEGYVVAMRKVQILAKTMENKHRFKKIILKEPGKVDTASLREELSLSGNEPDMKSSDEFAVEVLNEAGL